MIKVGLTGGIGAGKSIVARVLATMGFPVFYSDKVGKELLSDNSDIQNEVINIFGNEAYAEGELNRGFLAKMIFSDNQLKEKLNAIIHPAVREEFDAWSKKQNSTIVFNEAAILFETGSYKNFDKNILVTAPEEIRINRVMERDDSSKEEIRSRMENQWSDSRKKKLADFEIVNDGNQLIIPQLEKILNEIG
tara:strand:+ start:57869 stop:58444 length:576 start_codon:yes stop_codon:yes gene_type:complete